MEGFVIPLCILSLLVFSILITTNGVDTITKTKSLTDGETIVSSGGVFELGFFSPGNSRNRYVGIWYKKIPNTTVVWVANRGAPLLDTSGVLKLTSPGILVLVNGTNGIIWSSNTSRSAEDPVAQLFDSGNMVVRNADDEIKAENFLWQSFDYPGNTLLPGMKLGKNLLTGQEWYFSSWKSVDDPGPGVVTFVLDTQGYPQTFLRNGATDLYGSGPWNGLRFSTVTDSNPIFRFNYDFRFNYGFNTEEVYYTYKLPNTTVVTRTVVSHEGYIAQWAWVDQTRGWIAMASAPVVGCDIYASCGPYGICKLYNSPMCRCLDKFVPKNPKKWELRDWSNGCVRRTPLGCHKGGEDGFVKYLSVKLPDTRNSSFDIRMSLEECRRTCLGNCSCTAYTNLDIRKAGSGCLLWFGDLIDIKEFIEGGGQDIYVRMASSESEDSPYLFCINGPNSYTVYVAGKDLLSFDLDTSIGAGNNTLTEANKSHNTRKKEVDLPQFSFASVSAATDNFSDANKLGEGGFGPVHKGKLQRGYKVAVKRLSKKSGQGLEELQNEAMLIAKLQHKNLVRLLGCCIDRDEKILIYEYMPNKSLDFFLFDPIKHGILNWELRIKIIQGIAQGLLYLHEYSRLRIIHRDLKASNILLDKDMNPKISDFGMARIFGGNGSQATNRIVGTYGYMSPEYASRGLFSVKSDVFSFGVLLLEILSGKRNTSFYDSHSLNLLGYAWDLWNSGRGQDVKDPILEDISSTNTLLRYINIGLLCVQESAADRPTMSDVVSMLSNEASFLPSPKQPAFSFNMSVLDQSPHKRPKICSENDMTMSILEAR
ncbi:hypothetical protein RHMOL_Rhmol04G0030200 [Rhododendron molle]|uniref:Uncharacterized protein n=1 Tax=Rhododendron molle TaxID=49168 RepID=A0ACC0NWS2_RHOML|nr:hypothetical protein RHMOL_Rhmol04G0030200 [Rhododendron molle]